MHLSISSLDSEVQEEMACSKVDLGFLLSVMRPSPSLLHHDSSSRLKAVNINTEGVAAYPEHFPSGTARGFIPSSSGPECIFQ